MRDGVMKFGYACTFLSKPHGETPAPPAENRPPAMPRPPSRRALSGRTGGRVFLAMLAVLRAMDAAGILHLAGTVLAQALHASRPGRNKCNRPASCPPPWHETRLENIYRARLLARCAPAGAGPPPPSRPASAHWGASGYGSDILNGSNRPIPDSNAFVGQARNICLVRQGEFAGRGLGEGQKNAGYPPFGRNATHFSGLVSSRAAPIRSRQ